MKKFELINHTADIGIKVKGDSLKEVFENLALGMFEIMVEKEKGDAPVFYTKETKEIIELTSPDLVSLVHDWLSELLYIFNTRHKVFKKFKINNITEFNLNAEVRGELFNQKKHIIKKEIKAVTYHALKIQKRGQAGFLAEVIFDI